MISHSTALRVFTDIHPRFIIKKYENFSDDILIFSFNYFFKFHFVLPSEKYSVGNNCRRELLLRVLNFLAKIMTGC